MKDFFEKLRSHPKRRLIYICCYTLIFAVCALLAMFHFAKQGKNFVWVGGAGNMDGMSQHYIALGYWGQYLRDLISGFFSGNFTIPLFDTSIGFGGDIIQTLSYYVVGDPLNLFSIFVPLKYTEYLYIALIILRMYLAGLSFSALALHYKPKNRFWTLIASMIYVFSSYGIFAAIRHPYFTNPMIYLPLVLLGAEYILEERKPWLFVLSVALSGFSNFYFFYMICILTVLYVIVRVFHFAPKGQRKKILTYLWKFVAWAVLGVAMSAAIFYPSIRNTLGSTRMSIGAAMNPLYTLKYYHNFLEFFSTANSSSNFAYHGTLPLAFVAVFLMWCNPRKNRTQVIFFSIGTLFMLFPVFGYLLNGMAYVANRWVWAYTLIVSMIAALQLPELKNITKKKSIILASLLTVYAITRFIFNEQQGAGIGNGIALLLTAVFVLLIAYKISTRCILTGSVALSLCFIQVANFGFTRYIALSYINEFGIRGTALENIQSAPSAFLSEYDTEGFYRYEDHFDSDLSKQRNAALINGGNSTDIYFSLSTENWYDMLRSVGDRSALVQRTEGLDNKTIIGNLANVKYYTIDSYRSKTLVPYGYSEEPVYTQQLKNHAYFRTNSGFNKEMAEFDTHINEHPLPFGYTYDSYITREEYDKLSLTDRQNALLYTAVLDEDSTLIKKGSTKVTEELDIEIEINPETMTFTNNNLFYTEHGGYVWITVNGAANNCETYLNFTNLGYKKLDPVEKSKYYGEWDSLSASKKAALTLESWSYTQPNMRSIGIATNDIYKTLQLFSSDYNYYMGPLDFSMNLGYTEEVVTEIKLWLPAGMYTFDEMSVSQISFEGYEEQVAKLSEEHLENVTFEGNSLTGDITVSENKLLCISLPYTAGWSAYVDGEEAELLRTDIGFMGLELTPGEHSIELRYFTPYLSFGLMLSAAGIVTFAGIFIYDRINEKRKRELK